MPQRDQIICLGILVADLVGRPLDDVPPPGRLALVDEMSLHAGGCAVNTGTVLARLGFPVEVVGKVGRDPFGDFLVGELARRGVGSRGVARDDHAGTSASMVIVDSSGERRFIHYLGANAALTADDVDHALFETAAVVHIGGALVLPGLDGRPMADLLRAARAAGALTTLDTVWDDTGRWMELLRHALPETDVFLPSRAEARELTGERDPVAMARALQAAGARTVAIKMGAEGCVVVDAGGDWFHVPAFVVDAVDATGAGDAFVAGFLAGLRQGWPLERCAELGNATGALAVMGLGAAGATRSMEETLAFVEETGRAVAGAGGLH